MRSALRGAADLDGDGRISYEETAAFVFGANSGIPNARYRPRFFVHTPLDPTLVELGGRGGDRLITGPGVSAHLFLEDARGDRVLDFHPDPAQRIELLIPAVRPLFVREVGRPIEWVTDLPGTILLATLTPRRTTVQPRGAEQVAFQSLFSAPFDRAALSAYRKAKRSEAAAEASVETAPPSWPRPTLGFASLGLGLTGGLMTALAFQQRGRVDASTSNRDRSTIDDRIDALNVAAIVLYSLAGTAAATFLVWTLWPDDQPAITVIAEGSGVRIEF